MSDANFTPMPCRRPISLQLENPLDAPDRRIMRSVETNRNEHWPAATDIPILQISDERKYDISTERHEHTNVRRIRRAPYAIYYAYALSQQKHTRTLRSNSSNCCEPSESKHKGWRSKQNINARPMLTGGGRLARRNIHIYTGFSFCE